MPPKLLLLGSNGQVGQDLQQTLAPLGTLIPLARPQLDMTDLEGLRTLIQSHSPDIIINAAAYTAVDRAEQEPELAHLINSKAPEVIAREADRLNAKLIHISTDYVFNGQHNQPYRPDHPTNPLGIYGQSKLNGEQAITQTNPQSWIIRTAWVYGIHGKSNFVKTMLKLGTERESLNIVADQIGSPTWAADLAEAIATLVQNIEAKTHPDPGIYHYTNSGSCSWHDFAIAIFEEAEKLGLPLKIQHINPIQTHDYPTPAKRPSFSILDSSALEPWTGIPPHWRTSLRDMLIRLCYSK
jgi:dTDP-4-dehydrorhamnose reductase